MSGVISSFPATFASRVPRATGTSFKHQGNFTKVIFIYADEVYNRCFRAYMSMHCSSLFPMCTNAQVIYNDFMFCL